MVRGIDGADDDHVSFLRRIPAHWLLYLATLASALPLALGLGGETMTVTEDSSWLAAIDVGVRAGPNLGSA